jgi:hypothetical protein
VNYFKRIRPDQNCGLAQGPQARSFAHVREDIFPFSDHPAEAFLRVMSCVYTASGDGARAVTFRHPTDRGPWDPLPCLDPHCDRPQCPPATDTRVVP